jgi:hypothetical protein
MMSNCGRFALFPAVFGCSSDGYQEYIERKILECPELFEWSIVKYSHSGVHSKFFFFFFLPVTYWLYRETLRPVGEVALRNVDVCGYCLARECNILGQECVVKARGPLVHSPTHTCLSIMRHLH